MHKEHEARTSPIQNPKSKTQNPLPLIAGNWKMYKSPAEAREFAIRLRARLNDVRHCEVAVFPPFTSIPAIAEELERTPVKYGGQDLYWEEEGAYTGAVSGRFLADLGCTHVLVGHSERRALFGDDDAAVRRKFDAALRCGLTPVLCCGENLAEREAGKTAEVVKSQVAAALAGCPADAEFVVAYEPVWAIGTGRTATAEQAAEVHTLLREWLKNRFPELTTKAPAAPAVPRLEEFEHGRGIQTQRAQRTQSGRALEPRTQTPEPTTKTQRHEEFEPRTAESVAARTRIIYGGSVKPENIDELMAADGIDGVLVGGASLKAESFERIVRYRTG